MDQAFSSGTGRLLEFDVRTGVPRHDDPSGVGRGLKAIGSVALAELAGAVAMTAGG